MTREYNEQLKEVEEMHDKRIVQLDAILQANLRRLDNKYQVKIDQVQQEIDACE